MARALIALLVIRVLAAPIASRPDGHRLHTNQRFVFRVCAWSAPRLQQARPAGLEALPRIPADAEGRGPARPGGLVTRSRLTRFRALAARPPSPVALSDRARC
jgi:hypothetical protein